jgi:hypothetical protein
MVSYQKGMSSKNIKPFASTYFLIFIFFFPGLEVERQSHKWSIVQYAPSYLLFI